MFIFRVFPYAFILCLYATNNTLSCHIFNILLKNLTESLHVLNKWHNTCDKNIKTVLKKSLGSKYGSDPLTVVEL